MKEELHHQKIFDIYYSMGENRSLQKLRAQLCQDSAENVPHVNTLKSWSKAFNWQERIEQRDMENSRRLEKKTNNTIVNEKANYRKIIKASIQTFVEKLRAGAIEVESIQDVERLVKLDLLLMGEATDRQDEEINITIKRV